MTNALEIVKEHISETLTAIEEIKLAVDKLIESMPVDGCDKDKIHNCFYQYGRITGRIETAAGYASMAGRQIDRMIVDEEAKKI